MMLTYISRRFQVIADYWSNLCCRRGGGTCL